MKRYFEGHKPQQHNQALDTHKLEKVMSMFENRFLLLQIIPLKDLPVDSERILTPRKKIHMFIKIETEVII